MRAGHKSTGNNEACLHGDRVTLLDTVEGLPFSTELINKHRIKELTTRGGLGACSPENCEI